MSGYAESAARYMGDAVATASPQRLLVMLYDRLVLDINRADAALDLGDRSRAHSSLLHAQEIVAELTTSLDHSAGWKGSKGLAALYGWLATELVRANIAGDRGRLRGCLDVVEPLRDSWHDALSTLGSDLADQRRAG